MPARSPIGAITNRFPGLNLRRGSIGGGQNQTANNQNDSTSPRPSISTIPKEEQIHKVELLVRDPVLWAEFKRRVAETNHFSNAGVHYVLHEFLEELTIPGLDLIDNKCIAETEKAEQASKSNGFNNGFGLLQSLRTSRTLDPPTPNVSYNQSPKSVFDVSCPESPGSQMNLSPTKTPLTPMSATTCSTACTMTPASEGAPTKGARTRGSVPDFLEQPNF